MILSDGMIDLRERFLGDVMAKEAWAWPWEMKNAFFYNKQLESLILYCPHQNLPTKHLTGDKEHIRPS